MDDYIIFLAIFVLGVVFLMGLFIGSQQIGDEYIHKCELVKDKCEKYKCLDETTNDKFKSQEYRDYYIACLLKNNMKNASS